MRDPDRRGPRPRELEERSPLSPEERRRMTRAALLRPINLLMLFLGLGIFALAPESWWILPLTLITYATLVALAARDPVFQHRVLENRREIPAPEEPPHRPDVPPERRARWLPRGETRQRVEAALEVYRKVVTAIEESGDVARDVLGDAIPRLDTAADRLVDVAHRREEVAGAVDDLRRNSARNAPPESRRASIEELEREIEAADAEIHGMVERFLALRARVVRISIDSGGAARAAADDLNASLDELNFRLEALADTMSPPESSTPDR
jgi:hypothetical protein